MMHSIDGRQLMFPGTGLSLVTSELLAALSEITPEEIAVFIPRGLALGEYDFPSRGLRWIEVDYRDRAPDYAGRWNWGRAVARQMRSLALRGRHFIPWLYNYGDMRRNVVLIPDLVYRLYPDYGTRDPRKPWWNFRGRLPLRPLIRRWEEWIAGCAEHVIVYSEFVRQHAHEALGIPLSKIIVIPLAAPRWITRGVGSPAGKPCEGGERFVLYCGGYAPRKNIAMLLRACGRAHEADPSFRCLFAGLSDAVLESQPALRAAWELPAVRAAVIRGPRMDRAALADAYRGCAFAVYPSHSEGFGLPVLEAGACAKLCLCGDNSSLREVQRNPAWRIDSDDENAWTGQILHYWRNAGAAESAGRESKIAADGFSWRTAAETILRLLNAP